MLMVRLTFFQNNYCSGVLIDHFGMFLSFKKKNYKFFFVSMFQKNNQLVIQSFDPVFRTLSQITCVERVAVTRGATQAFATRKKV